MTPEISQNPVWTEQNGYSVTSELFLDLIFTSKCSCGCPFCIARTKSYAEDDFEAWKESVKRAFCTFDVRSVIILGGEAAEDPRFEERMDYLKPYLTGCSVENVILTTNGIRLRDQTFRDMVLHSPITSVNISCMHYQKKRNDSVFRGNTLAAQELSDLHRALVGSGRTMRINTNVWRGNLDSPEEMVAFVRTFSGMAEAVKFSPLMETGMFDTVERVTEFTRGHAIPETEIRQLFDRFVAGYADGNVRSNDQVLGFLDYKEIFLSGQRVLLKYGQVEDKYDREKIVPTLKLYPNGALTNEWDFRKNKF